tara:strand:+ start:137 stop:379 length:243 start_codon:yes stop_codon:yes gene_type:complete
MLKSFITTTDDLQRMVKALRIAEGVTLTGSSREGYVANIPHMKDLEVFRALRGTSGDWLVAHDPRLFQPRKDLVSKGSTQ